MPRTVKQADERKRELLDTAMRLFVERGYSSVSMRDIAREADVTPGLAYHYFESKDSLFAEVFQSYAAQCAAPGIRMLEDTDMSFDQQVDALLDIISQEEHLPYHEFFHRQGNRAFHEQLSVRLCDLLVPHLTVAIQGEAERLGKEIRSPQTLADFIAHGLINLLSDPDVPDADVVARMREYVAALVASQLI